MVFFSGPSSKAAMPYIEMHFTPTPQVPSLNPTLPKAPLPQSGPGSIRYRRLFGFDQPVSWSQLKKVP